MATLLVVAGCGGGSGGSLVAPPAALTAGNAVLVSAEVLQAVAASSDLGPAAVGGSIAGEPGGNAAAGRLAGAGRRTILRTGASRRTLLLAFGPDDFACLVSGQVRLSGNLADPDTLTAGDIVDARFTDCNDGAGDVLNGTLRLVVVIAPDVGDDVAAGTFQATFDATFTAFRIVAGSDSFTTDGTARLALDTRQSPEEATITSDRLTYTLNGDRSTLTDFATTLLVNTLADPPTASITGTGTLESDDFTGSVDFVTALPLVTRGEASPDVGRVEVDGAGNSRLVIRVLDAVNVAIDVDANGDGSFEEALATTWSELNGLAPGAGSVLTCNCGPRPGP